MVHSATMSLLIEQVSFQVFPEGRYWRHIDNRWRQIFPDVNCRSTKGMVINHLYSCSWDHQLVGWWRPKSSPSVTVRGPPPIAGLCLGRQMRCCCGTGRQGQPGKIWYDLDSQSRDHSSYHISLKQMASYVYDPVDVKYCILQIFSYNGYHSHPIYISDINIKGLNK